MEQKKVKETKGWLSKYGKENNANESSVSIPNNFVGEGYSNIGRNYSPAWGGQFQEGGLIQQRIGAPSNGKYAKHTLASAQNGDYFKKGFDWQPKSISKNGEIIKDDRGQWDHPGEITEISGDIMTTQGYGDIPLYVVPDKGKPRVVQPNTGIQKFPGATKFTEYPIGKNGINNQDSKTKEHLDQLTNFTLNNKPNWLSKYK